MTEFTFTTCLTYEFTFLLNTLFDCFAVSNHWFTNVRFNVKFTLHTVNKDVKVKLTHTRNNRLTRFFVCAYTERWIFFSQTTKSDRHFFLVSLSFRLNSKRNYWLWEFHTL
ncbi:hypothetical protein D3C75_971820 [compost metagenome]